MTAAIYARYSSELQSDRSIEDQFALARAYAAREGLAVSATYEDRAMSGTSTVARLGLARMMEDAIKGRFTHLIVESLDRLSRDQADLATLYKRLRFLGIEIREVHGGIATPLNAAVRGLIGTIYIADLAVKIQRGLAGNIREGKSGGGRAYGYRAIAGRPGALEIVDHEAAVIRRIFAAYAHGTSPRAIAEALNRDNIPPPRGTRWNASSLNGSRERGNGILGNALYEGKLVWNKTRMLKHPDTGKRVSRSNPHSEWHSHEVPELRIVSPDLWAAAAARRKIKDPRGNLQRKPKRLLSGLLKCHSCGGSLVVRDSRNGVTRIRCSTFQESGSCTNNRVYRLAPIERAVLDALRRELEDPALIDIYVREYNAERRRLARDAGNHRAAIEKKLRNVTAELERTVTLMIKGHVDPERHAPRVKELENEERKLKDSLAHAPAGEVVALHPAALARYREQLDALHESFAAGTPAADALRQLVSRITIYPDNRFEIEGRLSELLHAPVYPTGGWVLMVAGEGVEPPTPGL